MTSRSGSTLTARIFLRHLRGEIGQANGEHKGIENWIRQRYTKDHQNPCPLPYLPGFREYLDSLKLDLWKGDVMYFPLFENEKAVFIKRDVDSVVKSLMAKNNRAAKQDPEKVKNLIQTRYNYMDQIQSVYGGATVYTDELIEGDYSSLEMAFEYCGLPFNPEIARSEIDPKRWHFPHS